MNAYERAGELAEGRWEQAYGQARRFDIFDPSTADVVTTLNDATAADAENAVHIAHGAAKAWRDTTIEERSRLVLEFASALEQRAEDFAVLDALCGGGPLGEMRRDVTTALKNLRYFAGIAPELKGETIPASANLHFTERVPYGVVVRIVAFNHPFMFSLAKAAAPLMAGNTVIVKPPETAPLSAVLMAQVAAKILPDGVLSVIVGQGPEVPRALVRDPRVFRIGFVGSETTGRLIQADAAATGVKHVTLELGGKNALLALDDVAVDEIADAAVAGMNFTWAGQSCGSTSRLLVPETMADDVVDAVVQRARTILCGPALDPSTRQGPLASHTQHRRVLDAIARGRDEGAELVAGGAAPDYLDRGWHVEPTVFDHVQPDMALAQQEVFGPVLSVIRYRDLDAAVAVANGVGYGLTASIYTHDVSRAVTLARAMDAGFVWVNGQSRHFTGVPYGGVKGSGYGRDESFEELVSYTQTKSITVFT